MVTCAPRRARRVHGVARVRRPDHPARRRPRRHRRRGRDGGLRDGVPRAPRRAGPDRPEPGRRTSHATAGDGVPDLPRAAAATRAGGTFISPDQHPPGRARGGLPLPRLRCRRRRAHPRLAGHASRPSSRCWRSAPCSSSCSWTSCRRRRWAAGAARRGRRRGRLPGPADGAHRRREQPLLRRLLPRRGRHGAVDRGPRAARDRAPGGRHLALVGSWTPSDAPLEPVALAWVGFNAVALILLADIATAPPVRSATPVTRRCGPRASTPSPASTTAASSSRRWSRRSAAPTAWTAASRCSCSTSTTSSRSTTRSATSGATDCCAPSPRHPPHHPLHGRGGPLRRRRVRRAAAGDGCRGRLRRGREAAPRHRRADAARGRPGRALARSPWAWSPTPMTAPRSSSSWRPPTWPCTRPSGAARTASWATRRVGAMAMAIDVEVAGDAHEPTADVRTGGDPAPWGQASGAAAPRSRPY